MEERFNNFLLTAPKEKIIEFIKRVRELNNHGMNELADAMDSVVGT